MTHAWRFIGRGRDLAKLVELGEAGERLVTLHGAAGMGKTRLAREHVRRTDEQAVFVDLSSALGVDDVGIALCEALGIGKASITDAARVLEDRSPTLVVLDNFEQLVEHAAAVVLPLLAVPHVGILVTSREILRVNGEVVLPLEPLGIADDAVELLVDRVRRAGAAHVDMETCRAIAQGLDGIPLALELAAPRVALLGGSTVLERLDARLDVLTHGPRDAARHQRTLRTAIDGSWNPLPLEHRRLLAQASVLVGAFDVEALAAVVEADDAMCRRAGSTPTLPPYQSVVDVLQSLCEKSLVVRREGDRFSLYLSIRDYAREKLAEDPALEAGALARHRELYAERAERLACEVETIHSRVALDRLAQDRDNVVAAIEGALASSSPAAVATAARAVCALAPLFVARGPLAMLGALADRTRAAAKASGLGDAVVAELDLLRGRVLHGRGRYDDAIAAHTAALEKARATGERALEALAFGDLTNSISRQNRRLDSHELYRESAALYRSLGDARNEGIALRRASVYLRELGRLEDAHGAASRAVVLLERAGDPAWEALAQAELAYIALEAGRLDVARRHAERASVSALVSGNWFHRSLVQGMLGLVNLAEGNLETAIETIDGAVKGHELGVGAYRYEGQARGYAAIAQLEAGDIDGAVTKLERALKLFDDASEARYRVPFQAFLGVARAASGDVEGGRFELASAAEVASPNDHRRHVLPLLGAVLDVLASRRDGTLAADDRAKRAVREAIGNARNEATQGIAAFDLRLALRFARAVLGPLGIVPAETEASSGRGLVLDKHADWFALPTGERVSLGRRLSPKLLLLELARHRETSPGVPVASDRLIEAGWPNERIRASAAKNRLAVALTMLRKLGLREHIVADVRGYFLDPATEVRWSTDARARAARH